MATKVYTHSRELFARYLENLLSEMAPTPISAAMQVVKDLEEENALNKRFEQVHKILPIIPMETQVLHTSLIALYFTSEISQQEAETLNQALEDHFEDDYFAIPEITVYVDCVVAQFSDPTEKESAYQDVVAPLIACMQESGIIVKSVVYV